MVKAATTITFTGEELLGKPTDTSITINIIPASTIEYQYQYGTTSGSYSMQTNNVTATGGQPHEVTIPGLTPNTRYYYQMRYHLPGETDWVTRTEHSFWTQRSAGSSFTFAVTSDWHANRNATAQQVSTNINNQQPDFLIDLGDTFYPNNVNSQAGVNNAYLAYRDPLYMEKFSHSVPIFLASGNHEEEEGWNLDDTPFSIGVASIQARKAFYPTPIDDNFYSANTDPLEAIDEATYGDEYREDYYAWTWGDALFIVIDEFQYTPALSYTPVAGEGSDDAVTGDQWSWTLGAEQFNWFKQTLQNSNAKYKFVFSHNMLGGIPRDISVNQAGYVRGGAEAAGYFEWGGKNADGTEGFASHRDPAVFGTKPIHQLMVENGVSAYFHGHDHQYVYETRDGIVYQEVPSPGMSGAGFSGIYTEGNTGTYNTIEILPSTGHLRVSMTPSQATVDYVSSSTSGTVNYSYTILPNDTPVEEYTITASAGAGGSISPSGAVTVSAGSSRTFTITPDSGYQVADVLVDGASVGAVNSYTFTDVQSDRTIVASFAELPSGTVFLDGAVSSGMGAAASSSASFTHTTGTGTDRLMLVGVSWNSGNNNTNRTISSLTFTPDGESALSLTEVKKQEYTWGSGSSTSYRAAAIYSLVNPPGGVTGTVAVTFSGAVSNGIVVGAANFAGVDQANPLGTPGGATGTGTSSSGTPNPSLMLSGLSGNEMVFDALFIGLSNTSHLIAADAGQSELWNVTGYSSSNSFNTRGAASTEQAAGASVTMSWTTSGFGSTATRWAIAAVPIRPSSSSPVTHNLTVAVDPAGAGTTVPAAGVHSYNENYVVNVTATPAAGYQFDHWDGACTGTSPCSVTMDSNKSVTAVFTESTTSSIVLDGAVSSGTGAAASSSASVAHTTGTGANRLMLMGVSWNSGTANRTISSVTFTPDGGTAVSLSEVITQVYNYSSGSSTNYRSTAIYSLVNPPSGMTGAVAVTFSGAVSNGIVVGAANFAGVDQANPLGTPNGATGTGTSSSGTPNPSVALSGLSGNELVFDTVFIGLNNTSYTLAADAGQSELWNVTGYSSSTTSFNTRGTASTEPAAGGASVTMSWTPGSYGSTATRWAIAAVPIRPASTSPVTHDLTIAVDPAGAGTTSPLAGVHPYSDGAVVNVTASANAGYQFDHWDGACSGSDACTVTMDADKSVTAVFSALPTYMLTTAVSPAGGGTISPAAGPHTYDQGDVVNVTATASAGYTFSGWSGACSGTGACQVTMDADKTVTAIFNAVVEEIVFTGTELLGRPEADSISVSIVPDEDISLYYEYGTASGAYTAQTPTETATGGQPKVITISGLSADTKYYYRMQYSVNGGASWAARPEHSFRTQRTEGSTFSFTITSDSHIDIMLGDAGTWEDTLNDVAAGAPDFHIDLGDTVAMDNGSSSVALGDTAAAEQKYKDILPYFNLISGSAPIFLVAGNHEQQEAWHLQGTLANSLPVMSKNAEKKFFLNPVNDSFYTGDTSTYSYLDGDQLKQDYYAWEWGDALFVVISPYWTTSTKPYTTTVGGGETDSTGSGDRWDWTLGLEQFNWLKTTLQNSNSKYKFVFAHQIVGGNGLTSPNQVNYGHGGVDSANLVEWGGYNVDGTTWAWDTERPGWGDQPIHPMMVANGVTAFFHGHDHQYAYEKLEGIVYQSVPSGSFTGSFNIFSTGGNDGKTIQALNSTGHLKVTVGPAQTSVDYIETSETSSAYTYTMTPTGSPKYTLTVAADPSGAGTTTPAVGDHSYMEGTVVNVTAAPASGYQFDHWSGACTGTGSCSVAMDTDKSVTAHFTTAPVGTITYVGDIGKVVSKTSGASLTMTTSAAVAAGDAIIIVYATDPNQNISPITVTDTAGNTYNEVGLALNSGQLRTYMFAAYNVNALSAGSSITVTANASVTARSAVASVFRGLADSEVVDQTSTGENDSSTTASSGATAATTQADELLVGGIGTEGPDGDTAGTWQDSFTDGPRMGTTGDTADTNITSALGWRIVSTTGAYTASKTGMTSRDHASIIATFKAAPSPTSPRITITGTPLSAFTSVSGTPSAEQAYQASGSNLTANINITAPSDFEISLSSGAGFGPSLTLPQTGGVVAATTIYVRFNRATEGTTSNNITHTSSGATTRNVAVSGTAAQPEFDILLGRPEDDSVTVNVIPDRDMEIYFKYGAASGTYPGQTATFSAAANVPLETAIGGLSANTRYFYRMVYRAAGISAWSESDEYSFMTQRALGSTYTFTLVSDSHLGQYGGQTADEQALYEQTLQNVAADQPDFHIDLGDTSAMDPSPLGTGMTEAEADAAYYIQRPFLDIIGGSTPFFFALGNHENEEGWNFDDTFTAPDQSLARVGMKYRKLYFPNPVPDDFYTGNTDPLDEAIGGDTNREDYYAWTWGDAQFIVINPYHYSMTWPNENNEGYGGEGQDGEASGDRWDWSLGIQQYLWLKDTLESSNATYKFVLSHHVTGGATNYGRGGAEAAPYFEWGGENANGSWGWDSERPAAAGWTVPIHQLFIDNDVDAYIHGHDHIYAYEEVDGIVYLEVPKPDDAGYTWDPYGYGYTEDLYTAANEQGDVLPNSGHIRVTISPAKSTFEYVRAYLDGDGVNGQVAHSFDIVPSGSTTYTITASASANGSITPSGAVTVNSGANQAFTITPNTGYHVADVQVDGVSAGAVTSYTFENITANHTITASFAINTYTITASAGANGTITPSGAVSVNYGGSQTFTITPSTDYHVENVLVDGNSVGAVTSYTFSNVAASHTISASFAITTYTILANAGVNGAISPSGTVTVNSGDNQTFTITPSTGYHVADVLVDGNSAGAVTNYTFENVTANHTITASFAATNVAPVAADDAYNTGPETLHIAAPGMLSNDTDTDPLTAKKVSDPADGDLTFNSDGSFTYDPDEGFTGDDTFTYRASDGALDSNIATVTIHVSEVTPPVLPSSFYGEIHYIADPPAAGETVEAYVPGITSPVATTTIEDTTPAGYDFDIPGDKTDTPAKEGGVEGDVITFKIDGRVVAAHEWHSGTNIQLDFHPPEADPGGPYSGSEGSLISLNGSGIDWGSDAASYEWDWDNNGVYDATGQTPSHTWTDDGIYTVGLKVTDGQGGVGTATFSVTVVDIPPSNASAGGPYNGSVGQTVTLSGSATCATVDTCTYAWDLDGDAVFDDATGNSTSYVWSTAGDYTVRIQVNDDDGSTATASADVHITGGTQSISLLSGWNLVSFGLHPTNTDVEAVFSSIAGNFDLVYAWNSSTGLWMKYDPNVPYGNSLTTLDETMGFWIRMSTAGTLTISGSAPVTSSMALKTGWNLVGYPSATNLALPGAFSDYGVGSDFSLVYSYRPAETSDPWKKYDLSAPFGNDLTELTPNWGYWIRVSADHIWVVGY